MVGPTTGWFEGEGGVRLRWLRWDAPDAVGAALVVHGFGDHAERYRDAVRVLGEHGFSVAAYDQRGHGRSEGPRGDAPSFESFLADLDRAWAQAERVLPEPLVLYGHSFGGLVVMRWLQTRPVRPSAVVLSAPWLALAMTVPLWKRAAAEVLLRVAPGLAISSGANEGEVLTRDPERAAEYAADPLVHHVVSARFHDGVVRAQADALAGPWPDVPTLLVAPGDDRLVDAAAALDWQKRHPDVVVFVREGGRHELHNDTDRDEALGTIARWLEARLGAEPGPDRTGIAPRPVIRNQDRTAR